jgi:hypothetical protein
MGAFPTIQRARSKTVVGGIPIPVLRDGKTRRGFVAAPQWPLNQKFARRQTPKRAHPKIHNTLKFVFVKKMGKAFCPRVIVFETKRSGSGLPPDETRNESRFGRASAPASGAPRTHGSDEERSS